MVYLLRLMLMGILIPFGLGMPAALAAAKPKTEPVTLNKVLDEIRSLKEGQTELKKELGEIKKLMLVRQQPQRPPAAQAIDAVVSITDAPTKGQAESKLVLIEFSDYQCPFCQRSVQTLLPLLDKDYIQTGKLRYVFMDFPLEMHTNAFKVAEAAHCAGDQGKYWEMHDRLFSNQQGLAPENLATHAEAIGLNRDDFKKCLDSGKHSARVHESLAQGKQLGIQGTPAFLLGTVMADGKIKAVRILRGALPYPAFKEAIDKLLAGSPESSGRQPLPKTQ